jgi:hypothetical protein
MNDCKKNLLIIIEQWKENITDEWLFEEYRQSLFILSDEEAFSYINDVIDIILYEDDESTLVELIQTIYTLSNISNTTELPINLKKNYIKIYQIINIYSDHTKNKLKDLYDFYRLKI